MADFPTQVVAALHRAFNVPATCVARATGRVNLIGDHTDYAGGLMLPFAIEPSLYVAVAAIEKPEIRAWSAAMDSAAVWRMGDPMDSVPAWMRYVAGVASLLRDRGLLTGGAALAVDGDLPTGAGLSSSAALTVGTALALTGLSRTSLPPMELAALCRRAEQEFARSPCGIMDQLVCIFGRRGHALLIDGRTQATEVVALPTPPILLALVDTGLKHSIATGEYRHRREELARAMSIPPGTPIDETLVRRLRHFTTENERVEQSAVALRRQDWHSLGELMSQSHASLRDDYDVSCDEVEAVVHAAAATAGVYGARITGGGFGGCVVMLLEEQALAPLTATMAALHSPGGRPLAVEVVGAGDGAHLLPLPTIPPSPR